MNVNRIQEEVQEARQELAKVLEQLSNSCMYQKKRTEEGRTIEPLSASLIARIQYLTLSIDIKEGLLKECAIAVKQESNAITQSESEEVDESPEEFAEPKTENAKFTLELCQEFNYVSEWKGKADAGMVKHILIQNCLDYPVKGVNPGSKQKAMRAVHIEGITGKEFWSRARGLYEAYKKAQQ